MTDINDVLAVYKSLANTANANLSAAYVSLGEARAKATKAVNDRLAGSKDRIVDDYRNAFKRYWQEYSPRKPAHLILKQRMELAVGMKEIAYETAMHTKETEYAAQRSKTPIELMTAPELDQEQELRFVLNVAYNHAIAQADLNFDREAALSQSEHDSQVASEAENSAKSIEAKYGIEFQSVVKEAEKALALIDRDYQEKLAIVDASYHDARRARMAIWQDEKLSPADKLAQLQSMAITITN